MERFSNKECESKCQNQCNYLEYSYSNPEFTDIGHLIQKNDRVIMIQFVSPYTENIDEETFHS